MMVMIPRRASRGGRWLGLSGLVHGLGALALWSVSPRRVENPRPSALAGIEFELREASPPPSPRAAPEPPPPVPVPAAAAVPREVRGRAARAVAPAPRVEPFRVPSPTPRVEPPLVASPITVPPPSLRAADLLRTGAELSLRGASAAPPFALSAAAPPRDRTLFAGTGSDPLGHARAAIDGHVREGLAAAMTRDAPGVRGYLWSVRRRMNEAWRPGVARVPNLAETLAASFGVSARQVEMMNRWWRNRQRAMTEARDHGGAIDAIESIGGSNGRGTEGLTRMPNDPGREAWSRNTRITRVEVGVDQDEQGRVLAIRVVRSSGMGAFDRAAEEAVRTGLAEQDPIPLPGGRRSRWSFTVVATRRLIAANFGGSFDESRGWFSVQLPGQVSLRSRVFMESSEPMPAGG